MILVSNGGGGDGVGGLPRFQLYNIKNGQHLISEAAKKQNISGDAHFFLTSLYCQISAGFIVKLSNI
jgi:hypothetical protein